MLNAKNQFLPNQNGEEQEWHRYSEEKPPMAKSLEPDAKSQMPKLHGKSEKSQIQMGHPWNQHLTPKLSLLMIF